MESSKSALYLPKLRFKGFSGEWEKKKLGDVVILNPKSKISVSSIEKNNSCLFPFFTSGSNIFSINSFLVEGENIFMNDGGVADFKYYCGKSNYSDHVISFKNKNNNILIKFIYFLLLKNKSKINKLFFKGGAGLKNISKKDFFKFQIFFPSLPEQQKIANFFTLLDKRIELMEKKLQLYQLMKKYYLNLFFDFDKNKNRERIKDYYFVVEKKSIEDYEYKNYKILKLKLNCKGYILCNESPVKTEKGRFYYECKNNEMIIGKQNIHNKSFIILKNIPSNYVVSSAFLFLKNSKNLSLEYLFYLMQSKKYNHYIDSQNSSTGQKEYSTNQIMNFPLNIIEKWEEKINILLRMDELIKKTTLLVDNYKKNKKFFLRMMLI